ncbi:MAG: C45 family autoproteolytic acyltransferase/hydrolase [Desulfobacteraceae bacterium]
MIQKKPGIIECRGMPYEIGRQYGEAARENIKKSRDFMFSSLKNGMFKASENQVLAVAGKYMDNVGGYSPEALELVKGIAEGSGISFEESFALKCYTEIAVGYPGLAGGMCTSFAVRGPVTADGSVIMGQNVDWHPDAPMDLLHIKHADGMKQLACPLPSGQQSVLSEFRRALQLCKPDPLPAGTDKKPYTACHLSVGNHAPG